MNKNKITYSFDILLRLNEAAKNGGEKEKNELKFFFDKIYAEALNGDIIAQDTVLKCHYYNICRDLMNFGFDISSDENSIDRAEEYLFGYNNTVINVEKGLSILYSNYNDSRAQFLLGICYLQGIGCEVDNSKAYDFFLKSATNGNPQGQNWLGNCYWDGIGTTIDKGKAVEWITNAAENNDIQAILNLGYCYDKGVEKIVPINKEKAKELYQEAAWLGNSVGSENFDIVYGEIQETEKMFNSAKKIMRRYNYDENEVEKIFEKCAETNYPPSLYELGVICYERRQYIKAAEYFKMCEHLDCHQAAYYLGIMFEKGLGVDANIEKAIRYYSIASDFDCDAKHRYAELTMTAEASYLKAKDFFWQKQYDKCVEYIKNSKFVDDSSHQHLMATCYLKGGFGVLPDHKLAFQLFEKAAAQGNPKSMNCLSQFYLAGEAGIVEKNVEKGMSLLKKAMDMNYPAAYAQMAHLLLMGTHFGDNKNVKTALEYAHKAANMGFTPANQIIADCYQKGIGVEKNIEKANDYYRRALVECDNQEVENQLQDNGQKVFSQFTLAFEGKKIEDIIFYKQINDRDGIFDYARACLSGYRVKRDYNEGVKYLQKAISLGHIEAITILGICYDLGLGVRKDHNVALELFRKASKAGDCQGTFNLATYYLKGIGVDVDENKAKHLYNRCLEIDPDFTAAKDAISNIEKKTIHYKNIINTFCKVA